MAQMIEREGIPLPSLGRLIGSSVARWDRHNEVVITLQFDDRQLAEDVYEAIRKTIQSNNFRIGDLSFRPLSSIDEGDR